MEINDACECPFELDGHNRLTDLKKTWYWDDKQDDAYFTRITRWNRRRRIGTEREFLEYLGLAEPARTRKTSAGGA